LFAVVAKQFLHKRHLIMQQRKHFVK